MIAIFIVNLKYANIFQIFSFPGPSFNLTYAVFRIFEEETSTFTLLNWDNISKLGRFFQTRVPNDLTWPVLGWEIEQWAALKQCSWFCLTVRTVCDVCSSQWIVFRGSRVYIIHFKVHCTLHNLSRVKLLAGDTLFITLPLPTLPAWGVRGKKPPLPASSLSSSAIP